MAVFQGQVLVYDENCNTYSSFSFTNGSGDVHLTINGTTAGDDYIFSVKYTPGNLVGIAPPATSPVTYSWQTEIGAVVSGQDSLDFVKKRWLIGEHPSATASATAACDDDHSTSPIEGKSTSAKGHGHSADHPTPKGKEKKQ
jgi:hypothetical protein